MLVVPEMAAPMAWLKPLESDGVDVDTLDPSPTPIPAFPGADPTPAALAEVDVPTPDDCPTPVPPFSPMPIACAKDVLWPPREKLPPTPVPTEAVWNLPNCLFSTSPC
jgi:hypothetical protein